MLAQITNDDRVALPDSVVVNLPPARFCAVSSADGRIVLTPLCLADAGAARELVPEISAAARERLAQSDREFDRERPLVGSRCLWEAAQAALTAVGIKRGCPVAADDELFQLIIALDQEAGGGFEHTMPYGLARSFRDTADGILHWEDFEFDLCRPSVQRWVDNLLELAASGENR